MSHQRTTSHGRFFGSSRPANSFDQRHIVSNLKSTRTNDGRKPLYGPERWAGDITRALNLVLGPDHFPIDVIVSLPLQHSAPIRGSGSIIRRAFGSAIRCAK
jgi:hypothetical protein